MHSSLRAQRLNFFGWAGTDRAVERFVVFVYASVNAQGGTQSKRLSTRVAPVRPLPCVRPHVLLQRRRVLIKRPCLQAQRYFQTEANKEAEFSDKNGCFPVSLCSAKYEKHFVPHSLLHSLADAVNRQVIS